MGKSQRKLRVPDTTKTDEDSAPRVVSIGKVPGQMREVVVHGEETIGDLFVQIQVSGLDRCEILRNGQSATLETVVVPGDTIIASAKIRGNG